MYASVRGDIKLRYRLILGSKVVNVSPMQGHGKFTIVCPADVVNTGCIPI